MRIIIDTEREQIIVPDTFYQSIDKKNEVLKKAGVTDKKIEKGEYRTLCPIDKLLEKVVISKIRYHIQHEKKFLKQDDFSEKRYHIVDVAPHPSCM